MITSLELSGYDPSNENVPAALMRDDALLSSDTFEIARAIQGQRAAWRKLPLAAMRAETHRNEDYVEGYISYIHGYSPTGMPGDSPTYTMDGVFVDCESGELAWAHQIDPVDHDDVATYFSRPADMFDPLNARDRLYEENRLGLLAAAPILKHLRAVEKQPRTLLGGDEAYDALQEDYIATGEIETHYTRTTHLPTYVMRHLIGKHGLAG